MKRKGGPPGRQFTALILAGRRGPVDPVARSRGLSHKCLVQVAGKTMLEHVVDALAGSRSIRSIAICIDTTDDVPVRLKKSAGVPIRFVQTGASPSASVLSAVRELDKPYPLLLTTADHALLRAEMVDYFIDEAVRLDASVTVAVTSASVLSKLEGKTKRTMYRFQDVSITGSNLFALREPNALAAVRFWRQLEKDRKRPIRIIRAFGIGPLLRYFTGRIRLDAAMRTASNVFGETVRAVQMPYPEAAVDVDSLADLAFVEGRLTRGS